jgi:ParB family chromosome partitioning protein
MPDAIQLIPIDAIAADALIRDRFHLDPEAMLELRTSIVTNGLRMPVEVFELAEPEGPLVYGLISGFRRLAAFRELREINVRGEQYAQIPALVRQPADVAEAYAAMVEENAVREALSPFEQGAIAAAARATGVFATIEEAVDRLYRTASYQKRSRLRTLAWLAQEIGEEITAPEKLSQAQALRLAGAFRAGFGPVLRTALAEAGAKDPESQWAILLPVILEAERHHEPVDEARLSDPRGGRPRRVVRPRVGLTVRREMARDGWLLRFTGREATSGLLDEVLDEIERMYSPR